MDSISCTTVAVYTTNGQMILTEEYPVASLQQVENTNAKKLENFRFS